MKLTLGCRLVAACAAGLLVACGDSANGGDASDTSASGPAVRITMPAPDTTVALPADGNVPVAFTVDNWTLRTPGSCMGAANCGHVHINIDDAACNAMGMVYNGASATSPIAANFNSCPAAMRVGMHTITVSLRNDDHTPVMNGGVAVQALARVTITSGGNPTVLISSPMNGASVGLPADQNIPVAFAVTNFNLQAPGACMGAAGCGHVHITIDGTACNAMGSPYNNAGAASPINANFASCPMGTRTGMHTLELSLRNDDHSPVMVSGAPVRATAMINVTTGPSVTITSPMAGASVSLGTTNTVPVAFSVTNFTMMAPGSCGATMNCGHVHLQVDGAACNSGGSPYNAISASSPLSANFAICPMANRIGSHRITVQLRNDDHSAVLAGGSPVDSSVMITTTM